MFSAFSLSYQSIKYSLHRNELETEELLYNRVGGAGVPVLGSQPQSYEDKAVTAGLWHIKTQSFSSLYLRVNHASTDIKSFLSVFFVLSLSPSCTVFLSPSFSFLFSSLYLSFSLFHSPTFHLIFYVFTALTVFDVCSQFELLCVRFFRHLYGCRNVGRVKFGF